MYINCLRCHSKFRCSQRCLNNTSLHEAPKAAHDSMKYGVITRLADKPMKMQICFDLFLNVVCTILKVDQGLSYGGNVVGRGTYDGEAGVGNQGYLRRLAEAFDVLPERLLLISFQYQR